MSKEIEVKVLDINLDEIEKKLLEIGAKRISDNIQRILTYDFRDISSEYQSILYDLNNHISEKIVNHAISRLKQLFFDLDDLINEKDIDGNERKAIERIFNSQSLKEYIDNAIFDENLISKLNSNEFISIVEKYNINPNKWIRLRQTGDKTTITVKHILNRKTNKSGVREHSISSVLEYEIYIDDFDKGREVLELLGYYHKNYQEKRRITYRLDDDEIDIDFWPHIPPYMEIEGKNENEVYDIMSKMGLNKDSAKIMNADDVYTYYGIDMYSYKELKF